MKKNVGQFLGILAVIALALAFAACSDGAGGGGGGIPEYLLDNTTYTVTFNSNGGSAVTSIYNVLSGNKITKPADPTKSGFAFAGWYKESGLSTVWNFATDIVTSNITLYAKWVEFVPLYPLGSTGPGGGKIFYISENGFTFYQSATDTVGITCHYLEAAPNDMATQLAWASLAHIPTYAGGTASNYTNITGTATAIGTGKKNTALILATDANAPAAKACKDYRGGGKDDWFLPSSAELDALWRKRGEVQDWQTFTATYWSSSQGNGISAGLQNFTNGNQYGIDGSKNYTYSVRAVRAF